jgi:phosphohistidine phosphatase
MQVYIVRHAEAEPAGPGGDAVRRLTSAGVVQAGHTARGLLVQGLEVDRLWTSPLRRAVETAALLTAVLGGPGLEEREVLDGRAPARAILDELAMLDGAERVVLVGHMPGLGELVALAVAAGGAGVGLATASVARVDFEGRPQPGSGRLVWIRTAEQLRALHGA